MTHRFPIGCLVVAAVVAVSAPAAAQGPRMTADRLREVVAGVQEEHIHAGEDRGGQVDHDGVRHGGGDAEPLAEGLGGPAQHILRGGVLQVAPRRQGECLQLLGGAGGCVRAGGGHAVLPWSIPVPVPVPVPVLVPVPVAVRVAAASDLGSSPRNCTAKARVQEAHSQLSCPPASDGRRSSSPQ